MYTQLFRVAINASKAILTRDPPFQTLDNGRRQKISVTLFWVEKNPFNRSYWMAYFSCIQVQMAKYMLIYFHQKSRSSKNKNSKFLLTPFCVRFFLASILLVRFWTNSEISRSLSKFPAGKFFKFQKPQNLFCQQQLNPDLEVLKIFCLLQFTHFTVFSAVKIC